ncbi:uncharacterized protein LOC130612978 [Hydractinia symbiolongicarpus]|uniref:uncharacterized protein LOC130612978 n=1 Tax=Hydractinia symbiolongicarpus TaxID=13093 RepID=UPI00254FF8A8|nr:uncharacterized protein LOC130612978 [Hydractinia symbiolongicarpus]
MSNRENVVGFQFEPIRRNAKPSTDSDSSWESSDEDTDQEEVASRVDVAVSMWCKCGNCKEIPSEAECLCCCELESANIFNLIDNFITEHENFHSIILLKEVLWTALVGMHDTNVSHPPRRENVTNKTYRYASYRQFTWWVHKSIGRGVRRVIRIRIR